MTDESKVAKAVDEAQKPLSNKIELSSGVVLRAKKANPLVMIRVMSAFPRPKVPVYYNQTMGREMENPDDPDYRARVQAYELEMSSATLNALILLGTELESTPKGFPQPHPQNKNGHVTWPSWIDEYRLLGIPVHPDNESWRYLTWVTFKAVTDEEDLKKIEEVVGRLSGISERAVQSAEGFPGSE